MAEVSAYIKNQAEANAKVKADELARRELFKLIHGLPAESLPPVELAQKIGSHSIEHFHSIMIHAFDEFLRRFDLRPDMNVLDIGCGCGRLAIPFSRYLTTGRYYGLDVWPEGIDWCRKNIAASYQSMHFELMEAKNNYYFDKRNELTNKFALSFIEQGSVDFAYAISVFSHLVSADSMQYFHELRRVLRKDGAAYITGFVIDRWFHEFVRKTGKHRDVKKVGDREYCAYERQDFFVGFELSKWKEMFADAGLEVVSIEVGKWAMKPGAAGYQDVFVVTPKPD